MRFRTTIRGVDKLKDKFKQITIWSTSKYVSEVVNEGYRFARSKAPRKTGALQRAIYRQKRGTKRASLNLKLPHNKDGRNRPYHLWQHGIGTYDLSTGKFAPTSGDPKFMFTTQEYMEKDVIRRFDRRFKKIFG